MRVLAKVTFSLALLVAVTQQLSDGLKHYQKEEYQLALEDFNEIIKKHEVNPYTDDAYYWAGMCYRQMKRSDEASRCFSEVKEKFPQSEYYDKALEELKNIQAEAVQKMLFDSPGNTWLSFCGALKFGKYEEAYKCVGKDLRAQCFPDLKSFQDAYPVDACRLLGDSRVLKTEFPDENSAEIEIGFGPDDKRASVVVKLVKENNQWMLGADKNQNNEPKNLTTVPKFVELPTEEFALEISAKADKIEMTIKCSLTLIFDFTDEKTVRNDANLAELRKAAKFAGPLIRAALNDKLRSLITPELTSESLQAARPDLEKFIAQEANKAFQRRNYPGKLSQTIFTSLGLTATNSSKE